MKCLIHLSFTFIILCSAWEMKGQEFPCDGQLLFGMNNGTSTRISRPVYIPFSPPFLSPWAVYPNQRFDAMGFNARDNYIYAVQEETNAIIRLQRGGVFDTVGTVNQVDTLNVYAGDCTVDGLYLIYENNLKQLLVFDVVDDFSLLQRIDLYWDPSSDNQGPFKTTIFDFAVDPNIPNVAYSYQGLGEGAGFNPEATRGHLLRIDLDFDGPTLGMVTPLEAINTEEVTHIGAMMFSPNSVLHAYASNKEGTNPEQDHLLSINQFTGETFSILQGPDMVLSDGCSCPYSFSFSNLVPREGMFCTNDRKTFTLQIQNNSYNNIEDVTLRDTFPIGTRIESVEGITMDNVTAIRGIGTNILEIEGIDIFGKALQTIEIKVSTIDAPVGPTLNQAFLYDLPDRFGGVMASDELGTVGELGDPSRFTIVATKLENVSWDVSLPTDCIQANDGSIRIHSPEFIPGQSYEIKMRNKIGWEEFVFQKVIDQNGAIHIDSLQPGNYQVYQLRTLSDNCSVAIKDTTIILDPPNSLLQQELLSNSPVCEGQDLELSSTSNFPVDIRWLGPNLYSSENTETVLPAVTSNYSGMYRSTIKYGFCEKSDTIDVLIEPQVQASISGDSLLCERDRLLLKGKGEGSQINFSWTGPQDFSASKEQISMYGVKLEQAGYYELIASNQACQDTLGVGVKIQVTPTVQIEQLIKTDFCEDLILSPNMDGLEDANYHWMPGEGLTCNDCPSPQVQALVQSTYKLIVTNANGCSDSTDTHITLDKLKRAYVPNVFRPNSLGENNLFTIYPGCTTRQLRKIEIYNRWGSLVFEDQSFDENAILNAWDGSFLGDHVEPGVYMWILELETVDGKIETLSGDITVLH